MGAEEEGRSWTESQTDTKEHESWGGSRTGNTGDGEEEVDDHWGARESDDLEVSALTRQKSLHGRKLATVDSTEVRAAVLLDKRNGMPSKRMTDLKLSKQSGAGSPGMGKS